MLCSWCLSFAVSPPPSDCEGGREDGLHDSGVEVSHQGFWQVELLQLWQGSGGKAGWNLCFHPAALLLLHPRISPPKCVPQVSVMLS